MTQPFRLLSGMSTFIALAMLALAPAVGSASEQDDLTQQKDIEKLRQEIAEACKATAEAQASNRFASGVVVRRASLASSNRSRARAAPTSFWRQQAQAFTSAKG